MSYDKEMTDSFTGKRYDAVKALEEDVDLLLKRAGELIKSQNKCSKEVEALSKEVDGLARSNSEVTHLLQDMRSVVTKETVQRLYTQLSAELGTEMTAMVGQVRGDLSADAVNSLRPLSGKLQQLQSDMLDLHRQCEEQYATKEELRSVNEVVMKLDGSVFELSQEVQGVKDSISISMELCVRKEDVGGMIEGAVESAVAGAVEVAVSSAVAGAVESAVAGAVEVAVSSAVAGAVESAVAGAVESAVAGAVESAVSSAVAGAVESAVSSAVAGAVSSAVEVAVAGAVSSAVESAVATAVSQLKPLPPSSPVTPSTLALTIPLPPEVTPDSLQDALLPYLRKEDALHESDIRSILKGTLTKQDLLTHTESLITKQTADASYLTRNEFDALKTIIVTKNDLQTLGKNELDELRGEQEMLKRSVPTRDHLNLLRVECDALRDTCNMLEERIKRVTGVGSGSATTPSPETNDITSQLKDMKQQLDLLTSKCSQIPDTKGFDFVTASFKYMKIGSLRFLMSNGFPLTEPLVSFQLNDLELPSDTITASTGVGYLSTLNAEGQLVFKHTSDSSEVTVRRFMFWY